MLVHCRDHSLRRRLGLGGLLDDGDRCDRGVGLRLMWWMWRGMGLGRGFLVRLGVNMGLGELRIYLGRGMIVRGGTVVVVDEADAGADAGGGGVYGEDTSVSCLDLCPLVVRGDVDGS